MNERGILTLDSLFGLAVIALLTLTIVPYIHYLNHHLSVAKQSLHASEVALMGAYQVKKFNTINGVHEIDSTIYKWQYDGNTICVDYKSNKGDETYCIDKN